jgi:hypothetical protein
MASPVPDLQWFADHAGTRPDRPVPDAPPPFVCPGCGTDLTDGPRSNAGLRLVYRHADCRARHKIRMRHTLTFDSAPEGVREVEWGSSETRKRTPMLSTISARAGMGVFALKGVGYGRS